MASFLSRPQWVEADWTKVSEARISVIKGVCIFHQANMFWLPYNDFIRNDWDLFL